MGIETKIMGCANEIADQFVTGFCDDRMVKNFSDVIRKYIVHTARKPLSNNEIWIGYQVHMYDTTKAFKAGVRFAEKAHGIGADDE